MAELDGKRALITGAAGGIGLETAKLFVDLGAQVMMADIADEPLEKEAAELGAPSVHCDVTVSADVEQAVAKTVEVLGGIDILVSNAGIEQNYPLTDHPEDEFKQIFDVNVNSVFYGLKYGAPAIIASGGGCIVNMASAAALGGVPLFGAYGATKAAVVSLSQTAAVELRDAGVRVNAVCPAFIGTAMVARLTPIVQGYLGTDIGPIVEHFQGRLGTTREVAEVIAFLASDRASFVNGVAFAIDNALTERLL